MQLLSIPTIYRWLITLAFVALIVMLSVMPGKSQYGDSVFVWLVEHTPTLIQKFMHIACYATTAVLFAWSLEAVDSVTVRLLLAFFLASSLGGGLEWYQTQVPGRFGTIFDVFLNALGSFAGVLLAMVLL